MKVMKGLLLGSAAGVVAISGAQAADLPVKAKAVEYVKVCSAYGAGFYYIPGTDICLRVGGYLRVDYYIHGPAGNGQTWFNGDTAIPINDADNASGWRSRGAMILDARTNTAYGTLRSYMVTHISNETGTGPTSGNVASMDAAFIQFAGFTFGYAPSLMKFAGAYGFNAIVGSGDLVGTSQIAYTAQLGNGVSASIGIEDPQNRRGKIGNSTATGGNLTVVGSITALAGANAGGQRGEYYPDVVANVRVDQAWGSAILYGAAHNVETTAVSNHLGGNKWGYAVGGGIEVKLDSIAPKDRAQIFASYTKGATGYLTSGPARNPGVWAVVNNVGVGPEAIWADAEALPGTTLNLAKAWGGVAQFQHYWTPMLRTNIGVGYVSYNVPNTAAVNGNALPDFKMWQGTLATIWSPVANLDLGVEVMYVDIETRNGTLVSQTGQFNRGNASGNGWAGTFRAQRNF